VRSVHDPAVIWLNISSGRPSAIVTSTCSSGTSRSSAIIIATEVVTPWPISARGRSSRAIPSLPISSFTSGIVGWLATTIDWEMSHISSMVGG
jgi:hypothetical protein